MNCAALETPAGIILIDCGVSFPESELLGYDTVIPDFDWLIEREDRLLGLLLTHAHMDHIGAVSWLLRELDLPVYGGALSLALVRAALEEAGIADSTDLRLMEPGKCFNLGDVLVEPVHINHSIPQTTALALHTPAGVFFHTADFKIDHGSKLEPPADLERMRELGEMGVRVLFSDSTNVQLPGRAGSEVEVAAALREVVADARDGAIMVPMLSSNLWRVQALVDAAAENGRQIVPLGYSLQRNVRIGRELGLLRVPDSDLILSADRIENVDRDKLMILASGAQGEARAAFARLCRGEVRGFKLRQGDTAIYSSRVIPGNERAVYALWDSLVRQGVKLITPDDAPIHCSGHARSDEHRELMRLLKADIVIPVHGDYRFLASHAAIAKQEGAKQTWMLDNGEKVAISAETSWREERIQLQEQIVDGAHVVALGGSSMRERVRLARSGLIAAVVWLDPDAAELATPVHLLTHGLFDREDSPEDLGPSTLRALTVEIEDAFFRLPKERRSDAAEVRELVRQILRRSLRRLLGIRPVIEIIVRTEAVEANSD